MGAIITYLTVTIDKRVIAAAPMAGTPDWSFLSSLEGRRLDGTTGRYEPLSHPERFYPCAFLMVHGTIDRTCPIEGPRWLFQALKPFYHKTSEKLQMSEYRGQGHTVDAKMKQEAIAWLERWLVKEQPKRK
jgi:pimeloyl-ACP methyl ester carboxylesterase